MPKSEIYEVPVSAEAVVQADIGGMTIAFTRVVVSDELDPWLDTCRRAINRQRAQHELVEALVDIEARREALATSPEREREILRTRAAERIRLVASFEAAHAAVRARGDFQLTSAQRKGLTDYDDETERKRAEFAAEREKVKADIPHYEARAARARAIIAGKERAEVIGQRDEFPAAAD